MNKHLYFICPTDHLETVIQKISQEKNYYLTSLGNSIDLDFETMGQINSLIESKKITQISFILSNNNHFFNEPKNLELHQMSIHLIEKIKELRSQISGWLVDDIIINASIYNPNKAIFVEANSFLFKVDGFRLN
jgi:hypothetical protein